MTERRKAAEAVADELYSLSLDGLSQEELANLVELGLRLHEAGLLRRYMRLVVKEEGISYVGETANLKDFTKEEIAVLRQIARELNAGDAPAGGEKDEQPTP